MIEKIKISSLVVLGLLPNYLLYKLSYHFNFVEILGYIIYAIAALFIIFRWHLMNIQKKQTTYLFSLLGMLFIIINLGIFLDFNHTPNFENLLVIENHHHQIKFKKSGDFVLRETCDNIKYYYEQGKYELIEDTILLNGKVFNRKNFNKLSIKGKKVQLVSEDEKRNDYFTFSIIEDNRNKELK